jgi:hypothetical protein
MAGIVVTVGVGDADDRTVERIVGIAHRLDEGLAQEQRKPGVAVTGQSLAKPVSHCWVSFALRFVAAVMASPALLSIMSPKCREKSPNLTALLTIT